VTSKSGIRGTSIAPAGRPTGSFSRPYANDTHTGTRNWCRKPIPENGYHKPKRKYSIILLVMENRYHKNSVPNRSSLKTGPPDWGTRTR